MGTFQIKYYGVMYIVAFSLTYILLNYRIKKHEFEIEKEKLENFFFTVIIWVLIGGRLGYVLFYNFMYYLKNPLEIFLPFSFNGGFRFTGIAGMSYHGAVIAAFIGTWLFCRKSKIDLWKFVDFVMPAVPLGYTFGRLGNFINGELYGRETASWIGMNFPLAGGGALRHPSQLYEAFFEGIVIFIILWSLRNKKFVKGIFFSAYLILYGLVRFVIEYFREPDDHLGFVLLNLSMGQVLCMVMILSGLVILKLGSNKKNNVLLEN
ncbi:MAG: prolipoprotein diacylglyceryl transferase [Candidatus Delongbacteria bacterium]|nr:prolipoprotein diacylglyceryl transferase [Candidatus Delongbacteria bacterium]